jgi:hypothetical protein
MSLEMNAENRNTRMNIPTRRCCSFCRKTGHNITTCNAEILSDFERLCIVMESNLDTEAFREWLYGYSLEHQNVTRAYAVRYCGISVRSYMLTCVDNIVTRISGLNNAQQPRQNAPQLEQQTSYDVESLNRLRHALSVSQTPLLLRMLSVNNRDDLTEVMMFIDTLNRIQEDLTYNRKFNIETTIVECSHINVCECNICYEQQSNKTFIKLNCGHKFCKDCIKQSLQNVRTEQPQCSFCRSEIKKMEFASQEFRNEFDELITTL